MRSATSSGATPRGFTGLISTASEPLLPGCGRHRLVRVRAGRCRDRPTRSRRR
ncbi:hypothetical protein R2601_03323 [Salipiger bermudensis HTCC2601]|uniref:Uncharacterized protein n=1 Tax=Salipiger bermudensis (strain DSM 26914 / JCM 13377 / KCTC 12554 / HTCC2601) TaxID=314265 RepID=Q0FWI1_SALBH|nr:hypothetical protein R2601_03323 [Salipiger bermudensis HTCC2601]